MTVLKTSQVKLSSQHMGFARIDPSPAGTIDTANELLQKNHDNYHMYFRDVGGHNHIAHSVLSVLAMGGGPKELKRAYDDGYGYQRPLPVLDLQVVEELSDPERFRARMLNLDQYTNFLHFFEKEIDEKGWQAVLQEYCFSRTPLAEAMFSQLYEGLLHPIIHLGFGIEFEQPSIIAEGLAHAASHDPGNIDVFFHRSEQLAQSGAVPARPLVELYEEVRRNEKTRTAGRMQDGPFRLRDGPLARAMDEIVSISAQLQIRPEELERGTAEMINCAAYSAGAAQSPGKVPKIDFFIMHNVTCSIFLSVLTKQSWIKLQDRVRLVEWKARLDLAWYAANGAAELRLKDISDYEPTASKGMDWRALYKAVNEVHDDGHIAKLVRALKNGETVSRPFEQGNGAASFPIRGDLWLRIAQMGYDTTKDGHDNSDKWVWGSGFDLAWKKVPDSK
ncbi:uncharacterized protein N7484_008869 [Penicillium longicatenatum]|uniref:uncharacterized protein n=1 Tax=Penicillium longicatenatum TaxID=1561947 RepID=UPI0025484071|nr:uncharacterized protein N7484_008869 [Penicillium longicatenatum]KAJ5635556.1 hypothetical protein N7484_008869 [Penicillium longicatenatum]